MGVRRKAVGTAGLVLGFASVAGAQSFALPASDPVGIARGGAGIAFGRSLEAASLNPALLPTLQENASAYVAFGQELQSSQATLESNQALHSTSDRNRFLSGLGAAWKLKSNLFVGLKLDQPFLRHGELDGAAPGRFGARSLDLNTHRLEGQIGWSPEGRPQFSFGLGIGFTRVSYEGSSDLRLRIPVDPTQPIGATNASDGLLETSVLQKGAQTRPSFTLGARWALSPRWTLGATYQSEVKGDLGLEASQGPVVGYWGNDGFSLPPGDAATRGATLLAGSSTRPGNGHFRLPPRATIGIRQRINQLFTWELDLRETGTYILPRMGGELTPSGVVGTAQALPNLKRVLGLSAAGEFSISKSFVLRGGVALDASPVDDQLVHPLIGGQRTADFSIGAGYQIWGGELSFGYQYRQAQDVVSDRLDRSWDAAGPRATGTPARIEGMGHIYAFGFRKSF